MGVPLVYQSTRQKLMPACAPKKEKPLRHHLVTMVRGLVFGGGAIEFQEGVDLDLPDFMAAEFAFDGSDGVLSTDRIAFP